VEQPRRSRYQAEHTSASFALAGKTVAEVLACWPQTAAVFMHHRLACVGCSLARFELVADVPTIYEIDADLFLAELSQAIRVGKRATGLKEREEELHGGEVTISTRATNE